MSYPLLLRILPGILILTRISQWQTGNYVKEESSSKTESVLLPEQYQDIE